MTQRWKAHVIRHPLWGAAELTLAWHAVLLLFAKVVLPPLAPSWFPDLGAALVNLVCAVAVGCVLWRWGWLRLSGVFRLGRVRRWWLAAPMLLIACSYVTQGLDGSATVVVSSLLSLLLVGANEEVYSRGLIQQTLTPLGPLRAALGVAVLFGVGHLQNYLFFGASLGDTLWQMLSAAFFGFTCAGLRYAIGSVWPMALVHAWTTSSRSAHRARPRTRGRRSCTSSTPGTGCGWCAGTVPRPPPCRSVSAVRIPRRARPGPARTAERAGRRGAPPTPPGPGGHAEPIGQNEPVPGRYAGARSGRGRWIPATRAEGQPGSPVCVRCCVFFPMGPRAAAAVCWKTRLGGAQ
ncbi:CPBP family intramembrane glutamic endopeptidase [Streptomyces sp. NPDC001410]|uniref:CPBP family intramembrane glutamic endopeptidase n=1 Tax=Streptomyces sp. NPDC001410 TaxID=3364574 RepID=UPI0036765122